MQEIFGPVGQIDLMGSSGGADRSFGAHFVTTVCAPDGGEEADRVFAKG
jgi:hypothetical protein